MDTVIVKHHPDQVEVYLYHQSDNAERQVHRYLQLRESPLPPNKEPLVLYRRVFELGDAPAVQDYVNELHQLIADANEVERKNFPCKTHNLW